MKEIEPVGKYLCGPLKNIYQPTHLVSYCVVTLLQLHQSKSSIWQGARTACVNPF
jgi:hypothetical protein